VLTVLSLTHPTTIDAATKTNATAAIRIVPLADLSEPSPDKHFPSCASDRSSIARHPLTRTPQARPSVKKEPGRHRARSAAFRGCGRNFIREHTAQPCARTLAVGAAPRAAYQSARHCRLGPRSGPATLALRQTHAPFDHRFRKIECADRRRANHSGQPRR
jgi:hypothetical protein